MLSSIPLRRSRAKAAPLHTGLQRPPRSPATQHWRQSGCRPMAWSWTFTGAPAFISSRGKLPEVIGAALARSPASPAAAVRRWFEYRPTRRCRPFHRHPRQRRSLDKAGRRRVVPPRWAVPRQPLRASGVLSIGSLPPLNPGVIVGLRHPVPHSPAAPTAPGTWG